MTRLFIVEQNALTVGGHYFAYTGCVAAAAVARGLDVVILHNRRFSGTWDILGTRAIDAFTLTWGEADQIDERRSGPGNIADEFARATREAPPVTGDHVLFHTIGCTELVFLLDHLTRVRTRLDLPDVHILLRYDPELIEARMTTLRPLLRRIAGSDALRRRIRLHTDTDQLTAAYSALLGLPATTLPIPFAQEHLDRWRPDDPGAEAEPITFAYIGDARLEKGYGLLPEAIAAFQTRWRGARPVRFVLQSNFNTPGGETGMAAAREALAALPGVAIIREPLDGPAYYEQLMRADAIIIPYDAARYAARSSGILIEAMAAGKPVVTSADSWMASQVKADHAVLFGPERSLGEALIELAQTFDRRKAAAAARGSKWRDRASGAHFVTRLFADEVAPVPPRDAPRILVVMDGDAMILRNGASRIARSQFAYLVAAGYRVCALLIAYNPDGIAGDAARWSAEIADRIGDFDLETYFVVAADLIPPSGPPAATRQSIEADLDRHRRLAFGGDLLAYLRTHPIDAVLLNYVTTYPVVEALGLADRPVVCEMHDLQALQKGIYGGRPVTPRDLQEEIEVLGRCRHLISLNPDEARFARDNLPGVPVTVTGVFPAPAPAAIRSLAGCRDLVDVVACCGPARDLAGLRDGLAPFDGIDMLFVGSNHLPNITALTWFVNEVFLPDLAPLGKTLVVAGSVTDQGAWPASPNIAYLGRLGTLDPLYAAARIVVLPILDGAGSPVKTMEALRHGVPVVTTRTALRGIDEIHWAALTVADDAPGFATAILRLLGDADLRHRMGIAARGVADSLSDPSLYSDAMNALFRQTLGARALSVTTPASTRDPDDAINEWSPRLQAANRVVIDRLECTHPARREPEHVSSPELRAMVESVTDALLVQRDAAILDRRPDLLRKVVAHLATAERRRLSSARPAASAGSTRRA